MGESLVAVMGAGIVAASAPVVRADDSGLTRGDGCFEGIRVRTEPSGTVVADKLDRHLLRMSRSAAALGIAFDESGWRELIDLALTAWTGTSEAALKLVLTRGGGDGRASEFLTITDLNPDYTRQRRDGITAMTLERNVGTQVSFEHASWLLGGVKTLSYAINMAAQRHAADHGYDDAIYVSTEGLVLEATTGSVVWTVGHALRTTEVRGSGILAGTTQELLFDNAADAGWDVGYDLIDAAGLRRADAVWITSSVRGPVELVAIDGDVRERRPDLDAEIKKLSGF